METLKLDKFELEIDLEAAIKSWDSIFESQNGQLNIMKLRTFLSAYYPPFRRVIPLIDGIAGTSLLENRPPYEPFIANLGLRTLTYDIADLGVCDLVIETKHSKILSKAIEQAVITEPLEISGLERKYLNEKGYIQVLIDPTAGKAKLKEDLMKMLEHIETKIGNIPSIIPLNKAYRVYFLPFIPPWNHKFDKVDGQIFLNYLFGRSGKKMSDEFAMDESKVSKVLSKITELVDPFKFGKEWIDARRECPEHFQAQIFVKIFNELEDKFFQQDFSHL